jgi:SAM-dependent methyltransferase
MVLTIRLCAAAWRMAARTVLVIMSTLCEGARQDAFQLFKGGDLIRNAFVDKVLRANLANRGRWVRCQLAAVAPGLSILDVGCGGQPYRKYCNHLTYRAHDFAALKAPEQITEGRYGPLDYVSDITHIAEQDATFDVILNTEVLEHVSDPFAAVCEMARLLKPGGLLILTAPLGSFIHQGPYHFFGGFTPFWYEHFLPLAGFSDVRIEPNGGFFLFFGQECQRVTRILFRRRSLRSPVRWMLMPLELVSTVLLTILGPAICYLLDKVFKTTECTVGYHVTARKK